MGQVAYRANLSSAIFPMTVAEGGRTVIIPGPDNNFDRRVDPTGAQKDAGIPQALYLENVLPTISGYQSAGYLSPTAAMRAPVVASSIVKVFESWSAPQTATGTPARWQSTVICKMPLYFWGSGEATAGVYGDIEVAILDGAGIPTTITYNSNPLFNLFSTANVAGVCYLFHNQKLYTVEHIFDLAVAPKVIIRDVTGTVTPGAFCTNKIAIVGSNNYLVMADVDTIYYSSTTTPTDFVASLVSGAGQIDPNNTDGAIWYLTDTQLGFYIHSNNNTLLAKYTGNARYPWKFAAVKGGLGIAYPSEQLVCGYVDSSYTIVFESDKQVKLYSEYDSGTEFVELNNYFKNSVRAELNYATNEFTQTQVRTDFAAIKIFANRYVLISIDNLIGANPTYAQYTAVLVFDAQTRRVGRLDIAHDYVICPDKSINTVTDYQDTLIGFVNTRNNTIKYLTFDIYQKTSYTGVTYDAMVAALLLGKFQYVRSRLIKLEQVEFEGSQDSTVISSPNFSVAVLPTLDGKNFKPAVTPALVSNTGGLATYSLHNTAQNHSVLAKGAFSLSTLQLRFTPAGDR
jgi:hypothetical protein